MAFIVVDSYGVTQEQHSCYAPAEAAAKAIPGLRVMYEGVRGQSVLVWPLPPLNTYV